MTLLLSSSACAYRMQGYNKPSKHENLAQATGIVPPNPTVVKNKNQLYSKDKTRAKTQKPHWPTCGEQAKPVGLPCIRLSASASTSNGIIPHQLLLAMVLLLSPLFLLLGFTLHSESAIAFNRASCVL